MDCVRRLTRFARYYLFQFSTTNRPYILANMHLFVLIVMRNAKNKKQKVYNKYLKITLSFSKVNMRFLIRTVEYRHLYFYIRTKAESIYLQKQHRLPFYAVCLSGQKYYIRLIYFSLKVI